MEFQILDVEGDEILAIRPLSDRHEAWRVCARDWQRDGDITLLESLDGEPMVDRTTGELVGMKLLSDNDLHHLVRFRVPANVAKNAQPGDKIRLNV